MDFKTFRFGRISSMGELKERGEESAKRLTKAFNRDHPGANLRLTADQLAYLRIIQRSPRLKATERDDSFGYSRRKGSTMRTQFLILGLIEIRQIRQGLKGRPFDDIRLTAAGKATLRLA